MSDALDQCWGQLNELHPFREGNGRTTQLFITALARRYERDIDWSRIDPLAERNAAIESMRQNYSAYSVLLANVLMPFDHTASTSLPWVPRDIDRD